MAYAVTYFDAKAPVYEDLIWRGDDFEFIMQQLQTLGPAAHSMFDGRTHGFPVQELGALPPWEQADSDESGEEEEDDSDDDETSIYLQGTLPRCKV